AIEAAKQALALAQAELAAAQTALDEQEQAVNDAYAIIHPAFYEVRKFQVAEGLQSYKVPFAITPADGERAEHYLMLYRKSYATTLSSVEATFGTGSDKRTYTAVEMGERSFVLMLPKSELTENGNVIDAITGTTRKETAYIAFAQFLRSE